jgi:RNA polymerase sigma factor (TIGR02999 family)
MRFILVDHARRKQAAKRGGGVSHTELVPELVATEARSELVLAIDEALKGLEEFNQRLAQVVEWRFFAGMTEEEIAQSLGCSVRTVQRDWLRARAWLLKALA